MIEIFGVAISEPMTTLTDYILAAVSAFLAWRIFKQAKGQLSRKCWAMASVFMASAAFWGGTYHGFHELLSDYQLSLCWKFIVYSVGLSTFVCTYGMAVATLQPRFHKWVFYFCLVKFIICIAWVNYSTDFIYVIFDYLVALLFVVAMQTYTKLTVGSLAYYYILAGVLVFFIGTGIQISEVSIGTYLNHNDLLHLTQIVAVILFYKGSILLADVREVQTALS